MEPIKFTNKNTPEILFSKLFKLRDEVNLRHLRPTNPGKLGAGWEHTTLGSLYEDLLDLIDTLIESYQGKYGLVNIVIDSSKVGDIKVCIKEHAEMLEKFEFKESWLNNQRDELCTLMYQSLYKLDNLT